MNQRPLAPGRPSDRLQGWAELVAAATSVTPGQSSIGSNPVAKRLRQIRQALSTLSSDAMQLVTIAAGGESRRNYERFRLNRETGRQEGLPSVPYVVPSVDSSDVVSLNSRFFTNGWIHVLEETEVAFLMMIADKHSEGGSPGVLPINMSGDERLRYYGLGLDGFRAHQVLELAGVLKVKKAPERRANGTFLGYGEDGLLLARHQFSVVESGFNERALPLVINALKRLSSSSR